MGFPALSLLLVPQMRRSQGSSTGPDGSSLRYAPSSASSLSLKQQPPAPSLPSPAALLQQVLLSSLTCPGPCFGAQRADLRCRPVFRSPPVSSSVADADDWVGLRSYQFLLHRPCSRGFLQQATPPYFCVGLAIWAVKGL